MGRVNRFGWGEREGGRECISGRKTIGPNLGVDSERLVLSSGRANGMPCVEMKCVDVGRHTSGERALLDLTWS